ncbi:hypothetical protein [Egicoccus sp. AB-alg2]|uniref:hypothetical protein n=1 Tax=Egicoccus sp. AB-alg2 TaxID=3242693 RepID=UPI00359E2DA1
MDRGDEPLTLYTSLRGLVAVLGTPPLLVLLGLWGLTGTGGGAVALTFLAVGVLSGLAVLLGYPRHVVVSRDGIRLVSFLRQRRLSWDVVRGIERTRPTAASILRGGRPTPGEPTRVSGGLLARGRGRRQWMLTDQVESAAEYDHLCAIVALAPGDARVQAVRPHDEAPPTFLYRRRASRT